VETAFIPWRSVFCPECWQHIVRLAAETKANLAAIDAKLADRKANEPRKFGMRLRDFVGMPTPLQQAAERDKRLAAQIADHREFMEQLQEQGNARTEEAIEQARAAGRLYEPVREGGGLTVAAVFGSSVLWGFCDYRLTEDPDEPGTFVASQILSGSQLLHLYWALCLIEESEGEECTIPNGTVPHWPGRDGKVNWRQSDLGHLRQTEFIEVEMVGGNMVIRHGARTRELVSRFRDMLATVKKA